MEPIRVLQEDVILEPAGIETLLLNLLRHIDRERLMFDFMVHRPEEGRYENAVTSLGAEIYRTPPFDPFHMGEYRAGIVNVLKNRSEYKIIHCHTELNLWPLMYAYRLGVPVRIAHSHNAEPKLSLKYFFFLYEKLRIKNYCTDMFMCSKPSGEWSFGKAAVSGGKVRLIKNGIETDKFKFNEKVRADVRRELALGDKLVVGHVGRFMKQKNHNFLLDIFNELHKLVPDSVLVSVGGGELKDECTRRAEALGLGESVKFLGVRGDVDRLVQGFDVFVLPSLWEGLPLTLIEAQTAGLPVVMSDCIAPEVVITENVRAKALKLGAHDWAREILSASSGFKREDCSRRVAKAGFDIRETADFLQEFYIEKTLRARVEENER